MPKLTKILLTIVIVSCLVIFGEVMYYIFGLRHTSGSSPNLNTSSTDDTEFKALLFNSKIPFPSTDKMKKAAQEIGVSPELFSWARSFQYTPGETVYSIRETTNKVLDTAPHGKTAANGKSYLYAIKIKRENSDKQADWMYFSNTMLATTKIFISKNKQETPAGIKDILPGDTIFMSVKNRIPFTPLSYNDITKGHSTRIVIQR